MNSRLNNAEQISDMEDRMMETTQSEQQTERNESTIWDLWDNIKHADLCIIEVPEGEGKRRGSKMYLKKLWLKTPQPKEGDRYPSTGSTEGLKQDEPKQTHNKTYHN